jgi:hypothetical protein
VICDHGRRRNACEDCAFVLANERGLVNPREDLVDRGARRAPGLPSHLVELVVAQEDAVVPDEGSDVASGTNVAKGTPVPRELVDRLPKRTTRARKG